MSAPHGPVRVALRTLGCKVNQVESEDIAAELLGRGAELVGESDADVVVINTCTVTGEADAKARKAVRRAAHSTREPVVVVTGCLAALDPEGLRGLGERVVVETDKELVAARVADLLDLGPAGSNEAPVRTGEGFHSRVQLKIEDGCDAFCTYCIVPHARGVPRSTPLEAITGEAERLVAAGAREIVITGINVGRYRDGDADLADVIERVAATGVARLRLSSIEPLDLDERLLGVLAATPAFCRHLHVPLQAGDDAVLAAMGRGYDTGGYAERIAAAREALTSVVVSTDVLAGFPGESDDQARATLRFCERMGFSRLHVFRYSARPGTPAAVMPDQVPPAERSRRASELRDLDSQLRREHASGRLGEVAEVLIERVSSAGGTACLAEGTSRDYLRVRTPSIDCAPGELLRVRLDSLDGAVVLGTVLA